MTKTILVFLIIFSFLVAGFGYILIVSQNSNASFTLPFTKNSTPTPANMISLTLSPENTTILKQQRNTINIMFDSENATPESNPRLIQMEIGYDPTALSDIEITPGDFFASPTIPLQLINTHTGRISYALETSASDMNKPSGLVARLTFTPNPLFAGLQTSVVFLGKTMIRGTTNDNILTATYGTRLFFATNSALPR